MDAALCLNDPFASSFRYTVAMIEKQHSYGIIPCFKGEQGIEVLVVRQVDADEYWTFPKGTPESGESPIDTARREVREEVGIAFGDIDESTLFSVDYTFERDGKSIEKTTTFYIGFVREKNVTLQANEIAEALWLPLSEVEGKLTRTQTKAMFKRVAQYLKE
jgi:bis(5'-nucleosidyl)-tetraphosphatase